MAANSNTIQIEIQIDDKGGVKILRQIGTESEKAGKKGSSGFRSMSKSVSAFNKQINLTHGLATKLATAFGLWKLYRLAEGFHEVVIEAERTQAMLEGLYGSAGKGRAAFGWIMDLDVPFGLGSIQDSFVKFRSVGIDPTTGSLEALLAGVSAFGGTDEVLKRASIAIQQMAGKGVISMEELRQQLGEAIPTAIPVMAEQLGMTVSEMVDIISKGQLEASVGLDAFFTGMAAKYGDATARMMATWGGMTRKMSKEWTAWRIQVMESGPFEVMKERLGDLLTEIGRLKKNGQLDLWAADMADGVLASVDLMMAGFQGLSDFVYGFRATFGIMAEKYYNTRLNSINSAIQNLETLVNANVNVDLNQKQIDDLKAMRAEVLLNKAAGAEKAEDNIQKMDQYSQKIQTARDELAKLRADMQARRGERPETDTDLSVPRKPTVAGLSEEERKQIEKEEARLWEYEVAGAKGRDDALLDAHEAMLEYENNLFYENAKKKLGMTDQMYSDLKFKADGYYTYRQNQLMEQADDYEKYTGDSVLAHQWLVEQLKELDKERLEASKKNNKYLTELSERTSDAIEENFSSFFKDVFRHDLDSAGDYFRAFCNSLLDSYADVMGQMAKQTLFGGGSSGSSGLLSSAASWISGLFGGGSSTSSYVASDWEATLWHTGKGPGQRSGPTRSVPSSMFYGAQRFHQGRYPLADNELPAIITRDETILPPGVKPVNNTVSVSMPITIKGGADERFASILMNEMEKTADRVVREHLR